MLIISPAEKHRRRVLAELSANSEEVRDDLTEYDLILSQLYRDKKALKNIKASTGKGEFKLKIYDNYKPWIDGIIESGKSIQDEVVATWFVWTIDAGLYQETLKIAKWAISTGLKAPQGFKRELVEVLAEEFADAAKTALLRNDTFDHDLLLKANELIENVDMHDESRARLLRELGYTTDNLAEKIKYFDKALALIPKIGCKQDCDKAKRELKKLQES